MSDIFLSYTIYWKPFVDTTVVLHEWYQSEKKLKNNRADPLKIQKVFVPLQYG